MWQYEFLHATNLGFARAWISNGEIYKERMYFENKNFF